MYMTRKADSHKFEVRFHYIENGIPEKKEFFVPEIKAF